MFREKFQNQISQQQQQVKQSDSFTQNNNQSRRNVEVKKKVWSVDTAEQPQQQSTYHVNGNGNGYHTSPQQQQQQQQQTNGIDYHQAFVKQQEELQSVREMLVLKDNRIRLLEEELRLLKAQRNLPETDFIR